MTHMQTPYRLMFIFHNEVSSTNTRSYDQCPRCGAQLLQGSCWISWILGGRTGVHQGPPPCQWGLHVLLQRQRHPLLAQMYRWGRHTEATHR